jgi:hypothetical protein
VGKKEPCYTAGGNANKYNPSGKNFGNFLGIYPKECNTGYSRGTCTPVFIAALFTIAKIWK